MLTDYHVHLRPDEEDATAAEYFSTANVERYTDVAADRGITELGVSEHLHRFSDALRIWDHPFWQRFAVDDLASYCEFVRERTTLRLGIEADFLPGREDQIANVLDEHRWDYVIGSVHFLGSSAVDMEEWDIWRSSDPEQVWERYFDTLGEAARSGLFHVLAHPDLVKVWGPERPYPDRDLRFFYERAMDGIQDSDVAIEVSTAGLRKGAGEIYPSPAFLEMCVEAGRPVALSSDAHVPEHLGHEYERALELLKAVGVTELAVFEGGQRRLEPVG